MNKFIPKVSQPGSAKFPQSGPHNPNVGTHGKGGSLAKVKSAGTSASGSAGSAGSFMPVQKPQAGLANQQIGQPNPSTSAAATSKPKRRGIGAAFYGEY